MLFVDIEGIILGEDIVDILIRCNVLNFNDSIFNMLTNNMVECINIICPFNNRIITQKISFDVNVYHNW